MATVSVIEESTMVGESGSMDAWILDSLRRDGTQSLDRLSHAWPAEGWTPLFLAIDRLSRVGKIVIGPPKNGDYLVSITPDKDHVNLAVIPTKGR
jgi:hypothetical protein